MLKEVIVVEGRNDYNAVKRAVDAEVITTGGFGLNRQTLDLIARTGQSRGIIILTDPDYAGEKIRDMLAAFVPGSKHAFISRKDASDKNGRVGVEYALPQAIRQALSAARIEEEQNQPPITMGDMLKAGLVGKGGAKAKRDRLGDILGIGMGSAKKILRRLNSFRITREEFILAVGKITESGEG